MKNSLDVTYNKSTGQYRNTATGRFVSPRVIREAVNALVEDTRQHLRALSQQYMDGKLDAGAWQEAVKQRLRASHTLAAGVAMGGKANMTPRDWGRVGALTKEQYKYLSRFAEELAAGKRMNFGRIDLYARAVRSTYLNTKEFRYDARLKGRWVLHSRESCAGCLAQAERGVQFVSDFPAIGSHECLHNCLCEIVVEK